MSILSRAIEVSQNIPPIEKTEIDLPDMRLALPAEEMLTYFVSKKVNRASYDGPDLIDPIQDPEPASLD